MHDTKPEQNPKHPLKSSPKLAALVVLVMILVATPAVQVWRHYGFQIESILQARDATEPLAVAVGTQRAVVAHQGLTRRVLQGEHGEEALRRQQQTTADNGFSSLARSLALRQFDAALQETQSATSDWLALLDELAGRNLQPAASDNAHHLVVEQLVQVIDLISDSATLHGAAGRPLLEFSQAQLATVAWRAALHPSQPQEAPPKGLEARNRRAAAAWQAVQTTAGAQHNLALAHAAQRASQALRALRDRSAASASGAAGPAAQAVAAAEVALLQPWRNELGAQARTLKRTMALWMALIALQAAALVGVLVSVWGPASVGLIRGRMGPPSAAPLEPPLNFAAEGYRPQPWSPARHAASPPLGAGASPDPADSTTPKVH